MEPSKGRHREGEGLVVNQTSFEEFCNLLNIAHLIRQVLGNRTRDVAGLTSEQVVVLCRIDLDGGETNISTLAASLNRMPHTVTSMVNGLEKRGLVARKRESNRDRRRVLVRLTEEGSAKVKLFRDAGASIMEPFNLSNWDSEGAARIREAVETLAKLLAD